MTTEITSANVDQEVKKSNLPVVIDAYASWCGPCQQLSPVFDELATELKDKYKLVKLDIDNDRDLAVSYNVSSVPTLIFIKGGNVVGKETGFMSKEVLKEKIEGAFK